MILSLPAEKKGKQSFQELSGLGVFLFACAGRSTYMSVKKVLLSSSVVTVVFLYIHLFMQFGVLC